MWIINASGLAITSSGKRRDILSAAGCRERGVAVVINPRMKRRGMRRIRANATAVVALRVRLLNPQCCMGANFYQTSGCGLTPICGGTGKIRVC